MFTGLVQQKGEIASRSAKGAGAVMTVRAPFAELVLGESIAVDGVCLTVERIVAGGFTADVSEETLRRTTLGARKVGAKVNLERAMPLGGRMGGHLVTGHVDGVGSLVAREPMGNAVRMVFAYPPGLARYLAEKGSVAIDGISLTVNGVSGPTPGGTHGEADPACRFDVAIIPHTLEQTTLDTLAVGGPVNLEVDILARYVLRAREVDAMSPAQDSAAGTTRDEALLARLGRAGYL